jgi:hypothetical protein
MKQHMGTISIHQGQVKDRNEHNDTGDPPRRKESGQQITKKWAGCVERRAKKTTVNGIILCE